MKYQSVKSENHAEVAQDALYVINEADGDDEYIFTAARMGLAQANRFTTRKNSIAKSILTQ